MPKDAIQKRMYNANSVQIVSGAAGTAGTDADTVDGLHASATPTAYKLYPLNASALFPSTVLPTDTAYYDVAQTWTAKQIFTTGLLQAADIGPAVGQYHTIPAVSADTFALLSASQALTGKTYNGLTVTGTTGTLTLAAGKTLTANNSLSLSGTDGKSLTLTGGLTIGGDTSITGGGTLALGGFVLTVPATGTGVITSRQIATGTGLQGGGDLSADRSLSINTSAALTWTGATAIQNTLTARTILPEATDTYDLGSPSKTWNAAYISTQYSTLFAQNVAQLFGGYLIVPKDSGAFAATVASGDTTIDFGKAMTVNDIVLVRALDTSGTAKSEYLSVGTLVSGTTYNVTRDLSAANSPDPAWSSGTAFAVLGTTGNGRIELYSTTTPRLSIYHKTGTAYNAESEVVRIGDLNGIGGASVETYGLYAGDGTNYIRYDPSTYPNLALQAANGNVGIGPEGMTLTGLDYLLKYTSTYNGTSRYLLTGMTIPDGGTATVATLKYTNSPGNLIINGGFETGDFSGWTVALEVPGWGEVQTSNVPDGKYSALITDGTGLENSLVSATRMAVNAGTQYAISCVLIQTTWSTLAGYWTLSVWWYDAISGGVLKGTTTIASQSIGVGGGGWYPFNVTDTAPTGATHAEFRFDITISGGGQSITPDAFYLDSIRLEAVSNYTTLQFGVGTSYDVNLYGNSFNGFVIGANAASNAMLDVRGSGIVTGGLNVGATSGALDGSLLMLPAVQTSGSPNALKITGAAHTSLAASTEASDVLFNLDRTVQFATGALSNQRAVYIKAPTYSFVGASTLSSAATLAISGAPVAGTNATVTNRWALLLESGDVSLASGSVRVSTALGARAYHNAAQAIATGVWTSLALNSELFDNDAIHDLVTNNSRMTCKTSGVYIITGTINIAAAAGGTWRGARFYLNGATPLDTSLIPLSANQASVLNVSGIYNLAVNDYVELQMYQDTGGNVNAVYQANVSPMLSMVRVA